MTQSSEYHGGLIFPGDAETALARCSSIVQETLEDYGHAVEHTVPVTANAAELHTAGYHAQLALSATSAPDEARPAVDPRRPARPAPLQLGVTLAPSFPEYDSTETSELLLAVILYRLVQTFSASDIEWLDNGTLLSRQQFLSAFAGAAPGPRAAHNSTTRFEPVEDTVPGISQRCDAIMGGPGGTAVSGLVEMSDEERLALAFRSEPHPDEIPGHDFDAPEQSPQLRLASWAMTGVLATVSAPVAVSLAAVSLVRGEDFRLNTQVLSLSAFVAFMHSSGAASAMAGVIG